MITGDGDDALGQKGRSKLPGVGGPIGQRFVVLKNLLSETRPSSLARGGEVKDPAESPSCRIAMLGAAGDNLSGTFGDGARPRWSAVLIADHAQLFPVTRQPQY